MSRFVMKTGSLSWEEHHEWATRMWRRMDRDHSESITRHELDCEEFRIALHSALAPSLKSVGMGGAQYERAEINMDQAINFCLRKADLNMNGSLSFEEFRSFTSCLREETLAKHTANLIFALFDVDTDARIDENEFREIFRFFLGHNPTEVDFQAEWSKLDAKGVGKVTRNEYIRWLQQCKNPAFQRHAPPTDSSMLMDSSQSSPGAGDSQMRRTAPGRMSRPLWNERFNSQKNINEHAPIARRNYFMRPQSLPELRRHYDSHKGFAANRKKLVLPEPKSAPSRSAAFNPELALPGGTMRAKTGEVKQWEDHWQTPLCVKRKVRPGTLDFRCPGQPAKWMFAGSNEEL